MRELPFRQIHMDFHTSPYIDGIGEKFNSKEFTNILKSAKVNSINLFAKCHHGMYYYPTKIGTMHPGLSSDLLGEQIKACRSEGIRTCIYTTVVWNEDWADRHPEWMQVNMQGVQGNKKPFDAGFYEWRHLCLNNKEHIEYIKAELDEIHTAYKPDAFWIDIIIQKNCVCKNCLSDMKELNLNPQVPEDVEKHDRLAEINFMNEIYKYIDRMEPTPQVYFNGHPAEMDLIDDYQYSTKRKRENNTFIDIESLPSDKWGYTHFPQLVNYVNKYEQEITMMNGKFHKAWGDFGSLRNLEALEYECFRAIANGAKCCVGDQLHPSGKIDSSVYHRIGEVYGSIEQKEKWCKGTKKVSQIGVYAANKVLEDRGTSNEGVYRMLSELHYLFDFVDFSDSIDKYDLVILPDYTRLTEDAATKIREYLKNGGRLLLTGQSGLMESEDRFAIKELGVEYVSESEFDPTYINVTLENFPDILPMDYVMCEAGLEINILEGAEVLAYITDPYFNRTYDRFCSHRQTPPADVTKKPCIVRNGDVIYISHPLFKDYSINGNHVFKQIIGECISVLMKNPVVECNLPPEAEVTLRKQGENYVLHLLCYVPQRKCKTIDIIESKIPLYNKKIRLKLDSKVEQVMLVPQQVKLYFCCDREYVEFTVPEIDGHQMIFIEV